MKLLLSTATVALLSFGAHAATLVGDDVTFECTNCGPPTLDTFTVVDGGPPELSLFDQFTVDVGADFLQIGWIFDSSSIISNLNFVWTDLDFGSGITAASIDASSTWGGDGILSFTGNSVNFTNNADGTVAVGDYLRINLEDTPAIPLPAGLPLILTGLGAFAFLRRKGKSA